MNTLWFVKFENVKGQDQIVFLLTLPKSFGADAAYSAGREMISEFCRADYRNVSAEIVCRTNDTIICFEPC